MQKRFHRFYMNGRPAVCPTKERAAEYRASHREAVKCGNWRRAQWLYGRLMERAAATSAKLKGEVSPIISSETAQILSERHHAAVRSGDWHTAVEVFDKLRDYAWAKGGETHAKSEIPDSARSA